MKPELYQAFFCPYAHRAWIAMVLKEVDFVLKEQNPYEKTAEWLAINPQGQVPAIVHNGKLINESLICVEYIDETWAGPAILPKDTYQRARARMLADQINKKIITHFYSVLRKTEPQDENRELLLAGLRFIQTELDKSDGPFIQGDHVGLADIALYPHFLRLYLLEHFVGFTLPAEFDRLRQWQADMEQQPCVAATKRDKQKVINWTAEFMAKRAEKEAADKQK